MVLSRVVPSICMSCDHSRDSNWRPLSVVTVEGTPNLEILPLMNSCATVSAVMSEMAKASGQRVKRSTQVSMYVQPLEGGRGPTRSMCTPSNLASGVSNVEKL